MIANLIQVLRLVTFSFEQLDASLFSVLVLFQLPFGEGSALTTMCQNSSNFRNYQLVTSHLIQSVPLCYAALHKKHGLQPLYFGCKTGV